MSDAAPESITALHEGLQLLNIALLECRSKLHPVVPPQPVDPDLRPQVTTQATDMVDEENRIYTVVVKMATEVVEAKSGVTWFEAEATYMLAYLFNEALPRDVIERDRAAFATRNAVFNAWPYYREFLQSMSVRTGIPTLVLPLLLLNRIPDPP